MTCVGLLRRRQLLTKHRWITCLSPCYNLGSICNDMKGPNVAVAVIVFYHVLTRLRQYLGIHTTATIKTILGVLIIVQCRSTWYLCFFLIPMLYDLRFYGMKMETLTMTVWKRNFIKLHFEPKIIRRILKCLSLTDLDFQKYLLEFDIWRLNGGWKP